MKPSLENFKPRLKEGNLEIRGDFLLYEISNPVRQFLVPIEMADVLTLCNGNNTVREIVEKIYRKQKSVRFRETLDLVLNLRKRDFFENGSELQLDESVIDHSSWLGRKLRQIGGKLVFTFKERMSINRTYQNLFSVLSLLVLGLGLYFGLHAIADFKFESSFRINNSYLLGLCFFYTVFSFMVSSKNLLKAGLLLLATGRAYDLGLRITPFFVAITINSEPIHAVREISLRTVYYMASVSSHLLTMSVLYAFVVDEALQMNIVLAGILLLGYELNPICWGDLKEWLDSARGVDSKNPWFLLQHQPNGSTGFGSRLADTYRWIVEAYLVSWGLLSLLFLVKITYLNMPYILYTFDSQVDKTEQLAAAYIFSVLIAGNLMLVYLSIMSLKTQYGSRALMIFWYLKRMLGRPEKIPVIDKEQTHEELLKLPVLNWFDEEDLQILLKKSRFLSLQKGQVVYEAGDTATHLTVLLSGQLQMQAIIDSQSDRTKRWKLHPVSIFGEEALLQNCRRESKAVATKVSTMVEIPVPEILKLIDEAHYQIQFNSFRTAIMLNQYFHSAPIFSELSEDSIHFMMAKGVLEEARTGETIFAQGTASTNFYLLIKGSVKVIVNEEWVNVIPQGGFFGEIGVIADIPRTATIEAETDCVLFKIGSDDFWEVLTQKLEMAVFIEAVGELRLRSEMNAIAHQKSDKIAS